MNRRGFTLLELMVALAVFSVMSALAYSGLATMIETRGHVTREMEKLAELQSAFAILGRDIEQAVDRPVRDEYGQEELAAMIWDNGLEKGFEFTRNGWRNPAGRARSSMQRISYRLEDGVLVRSSWPVLDRAPETRPFAKPVIGGVTTFELAFVDQFDVIHKEWPPGASASLNSQPQTLPKAIDLSMEFELWGRINRLYLIAGAQ